MLVRATERGFDNVKLREVDEEFDMPEGATGSWFTPVDGSPSETAARPAKAAKKRDERQVTMSALAEASKPTDLA